MIGILVAIVLAPFSFIQDIDKAQNPVYELRSLTGKWASRSTEYTLAGMDGGELFRKSEIWFANGDRTLMLQEYSAKTKDSPYEQGGLLVIHASYDWKTTRAYLFGESSDEPVKLKAKWDGRSLVLENPSVVISASGVPDAIRGKKIGLRLVLEKTVQDRWESTTEVNMFGTVVRHKIVYEREKEK